MTSICRPQWYLESLLPEYEEKIRRIAMTSAELRNRVVAHEKCMPGLSSTVSRDVYSSSLSSESSSSPLLSSFSIVGADPMLA
jgi:hypothetical protein